MKSKIIFSILFIGLILVFANSCKKDEDKDVALPALSTTEVADITETTATSGGKVTFDGGAAVTARGVCWSTEQNPTIDDEKTIDGKGEGEFSSSLRNLTSDTKYYVRAYATNSVGTAYGNEISFTTEKGFALPVLSTTKVTYITDITALSGGDITDDGNQAITSRGVCWSTKQNPTIEDSKTTDGKGKGEFSSSLSELNPETKYYVRAYATNSVGTAYGEEISFTTEKKVELPFLNTYAVTYITHYSAIGGGNIISAGGAEVTERGVCWSETNDMPTIEDNKAVDGKGTGSFNKAKMTDLKPNTLYYVRAFATNIGGTAYGELLFFDTAPTTLTDDRDDQVYKTVTIGNQVWMAENLKYFPETRLYYSIDETKPRYYVYGAESNVLQTLKAKENYKVYGVLYNWEAAMTEDVFQDVCPVGWHIPADYEWEEMVEFLGGADVAGGKLKEMGTTHWKNPNAGATDERGFTALPGGYDDWPHGASSINSMGTWWSSTVNNDGSRIIRFINNGGTSVQSSNSKSDSHSVRCVRNTHSDY